MWWGWGQGFIDLHCSRTPLGNVYCISDGAYVEAFALERCWFVCSAIAGLAVLLLAAVCSAGFAVRIKNRVVAVVAVLMLVAPLLPLVLVVVGPEGLIWLDRLYPFRQVLNAAPDALAKGAFIAAAPFLPAIVAWRRLARATNQAR